MNIRFQHFCPNQSVSWSDSYQSVNQDNRRFNLLILEETELHAGKGRSSFL